MKKCRITSFLLTLLGGVICAFILLCGRISPVNPSNCGVLDEADKTFTKSFSIVVPEEYISSSGDSIPEEWIAALRNRSFDGTSTETLWFHPSKGCTDISCIAEGHFHYCPNKCTDPSHCHFDA